MTLEVIDIRGSRFIYTENEDYTRGDLERLYKEYSELPGYQVRFK